MYQDVFYLVRLLDLYADAHAVDARLDEHPLILVSRYRQRVQEHFRGACCLDFRNIMPFGRLRGEIRQGEGGRQR